MCINGNLGMTSEMLNYHPDYRVYYGGGYVQVLLFIKEDKIDIQRKSIFENSNSYLWTKEQAKEIKETILKYYPDAYVEIEKR